MEALSLRDRRALAIGSALLASVLVLPWAYTKWQNWDGGVRERAAYLSEQSEKSEVLLANHSSAVEALRLRKHRRARLDSLLIPGKSMAAISAAFAELIVEGASHTDVSLGSIQVGVDSAKVRAATGMPSLVHATARFTASGSAEALVQLVAWFEESPPMLSVREAAFTVSQSPDGTPMGNTTLVVRGLAAAPVDSRAVRR